MSWGQSRGGHFNCSFKEKLVEREYRLTFIRRMTLGDFIWDLSGEEGRWGVWQQHWKLKQMERRDTNLVYDTHADAVFYWRPCRGAILTSEMLPSVCHHLESNPFFWSKDLCSCYKKKLNMFYLKIWCTSLISFMI